MLGLKTFRTDKQINFEVEVMHMLKKGQLQQGVKSVQGEIEFTNKLFGVASSFIDEKDIEILCF